MTRQWKLKLMAYLVGLGLLVFGIYELQEDTGSRTLKPVGIAAIEDGTAGLHEDDYLQVTDAYLLRPPLSIADPEGGWQVFAALGSRAMQQQQQQQQAASGVPVKPGLWVRFGTTYPTAEAAVEALRPDALYRQPHAVTGLLHRLDPEVRVQALQGGYLEVIDSAFALHAGTSPPLLAAGHAVAVAGGSLWLLVALWMWTDFSADRWRRRLAASSGEGAEVFLGRSATALWALVGGAVALLALGVWVESVVNQQAFSIAAALAFALGLGGFTIALWRSRAAVVLTADRVERVGLRGRVGLPLADVVALGVDEPVLRRGLPACTYTLYPDPAGGAKAKPLRLGSHPFMGGLDKPLVFGASLRTHLVDRLAPGLAARLRGGDWVEFGPVLAGREGIAKNRKKGESGEVLPWGQIESAKVDRMGDLRIKCKGKRFAWGIYPAKKVLNRDVLLRFMERGGP